MERNGSQGSDNASTTINPKTRTNACCAPQPLQVNSAANKSWLINYVEAVLPRHIINALTSTQAAPGENAHTHVKTHTDQHTSRHTRSQTCRHTQKWTHTHTKPKAKRTRLHTGRCVCFPSDAQFTHGHTDKIKCVRAHTHSCRDTHTHHARSWAFKNDPLMDDSFKTFLPPGQTSTPLTALFLETLGSLSLFPAAEETVKEHRGNRLQPFYI